ncbi:MAG TPA: heme exporter protein CcmB [Gammaproteobacteria bacterium]|nr:heme exporter protein CcmB [Gammaproteobacteria bacterium]
MMDGVFGALVRRDLQLAYRRRGEMVTPLMFFIMVTALFPLGLNPDPALLRTLAPGVIWVAALLAGVVGLESLFKSDYEDGSLELMVLSPVPLELIALIRVLTHWLITGLPVVILAPLMGMLLAFPASAMGTLLTGLLLGTPVLSLLGAVGAALTVGLRRSGMLLPLLILPLAVPVLIFGARSAAMALAGDDVSGPLYLLGAILALTLTLAPFAIAGGLRVSLEN